MMLISQAIWQPGAFFLATLPHRSVFLLWQSSKNTYYCLKTNEKSCSEGFGNLLSCEQLMQWTQEENKEKQKHNNPQ